MLEEIFKNPKERTDFIIAIVVVCLFGGSIIYGSLGNWNVEDLSTAVLPVEVEPILVKAEEAISVDIREDKAIRKSKRTADEVEIAPWTPTVVSIKDPVAEVPVKEKDDVIVSPIEEEVQESPAKSTITEILNEPAPVEPVISESEVVKEEVAEPIENIAAKAATPAIGSTFETGDCQIVVGAYSSEENRQRMLDKLIGANFVTYTYKQRGLYVASVKMSCDQKILRKALKEIRADFAKGAFIPRK